jgi:exodeoxyribonuclease VII small subunit
MAEEPQPSFEDALTRVERIVEDLERGEPSLSTALAKYEDGFKLLRICYDALEQAERSVALLTGVDEHGQPVTAPFDAAATQAREPVAVAPASAGDGTRAPARVRGSAPGAGDTGRTPPDVLDPPF